MRIIMVLNIILLSCLHVFSQNSPEYFLGRIPSLPGAACAMNNADRDDFLGKVSELSGLLKKEIGIRQAARDAYAAGNSSNMQNMARQMLLAQGSLEKVKSGGTLSDSEASALAENMMKIKSYSQGQQPGKTPEADNSGQALINMNKSQKMADLATEQQTLSEKLQARESDIQTSLQDLDTKDFEERERLEKILAPLRDEEQKINDGEGSAQADVTRSRALKKKIFEHSQAYCEKMTPVLLDICRRNLTGIKANLPDYNRLQQILDEQLMVQTGIEMKRIAPDLMALESIAAHLSIMADIFRFVPMDQPEN